jgi:hypothetical protein
MKLVDNWHNWHKRWSVWLGSLGALATAILIALPDAARNAWLFLPDELRIALPSKLMPLAGVGLFVLSMLAQLVKQKKLQPPGDDDANH